MTFEQALIVGAAVALAAVALIGALLSSRVLGRAGTGLRELDARVVARTEALPARAAEIRQRLVEARSESERALWALANLDTRMEATSGTLADKRAASDRLRASMRRNRHMLERIRSGARMLLRAIQMRREFLG